MDAPQLNVMPMFAVPFATATYADAPALNAALLALIESRRAATPRSALQPACAGAFESREDFLHWPDPPVRELKRRMLDATATLVAQLAGYGPARLAGLALQARGWFTVVEPEGMIPARAYPMSSWCAVYCVQAPEPVPERIDSGALRFHDTRTGNMYTDPGVADLRRPYGFGHFVARPVAGQVAIFPSWLLHEIAPVQGGTPLVLVTAVCRFAAAPGGVGAPMPPGGA
jgi:uncharacterized protein (TIGR02466 family)